MKGYLKDRFPNAVSYNRFVELESRVAVQMALFLELFCFGECTGISFIDSTCIPVCHNKRIKRNKVFKGYADKGYISQTLFSRLFSNGIHLVTGLKSNMKNKLMSTYDKIMLRKRSVIETINDELKNVALLVNSFLKPNT